MKMLPRFFWIAFWLFYISTPGHSYAEDTLQCQAKKGTCYPTICPAQKIDKGTCYGGSQLCCVDCPSHFLSYVGNGGYCPPKLGLRTAVKILLNLSNFLETS